MPRSHRFCLGDDTADAARSGGDRRTSSRRLVPCPARSRWRNSPAQPRQIAISTASIVVSFSLMVAMLIMVTSFRGSLEAWLTRMLPADLYVRAAASGESGFFTLDEQQRIATRARA
jgi:hypothetical protein